MTTYLVLLHLFAAVGCSGRFRNTHVRSPTGPLFQLSDVFSITLESRTSLLLTRRPHAAPHAPDNRVSRQRGKAVPSTASTYSAVFVIHHDEVVASTAQRKERSR